MSWLNRACLVLDRAWRAINVVPVKDALCDVFEEKAKCVETGTYALYDLEQWIERGVQDNRPINCVRFAFDAPEVIVLNSIQMFRDHRIVLNRHSVYRRDGNTCQYCGGIFSESDLSLDHVVPRCQGGRLSWVNTVCSCKKCNVAKAGRTPKQAGMSLIRKPAQPIVWSPLYSKRTRLRGIPESWSRFILK